MSKILELNEFVKLEAKGDQIVVDRDGLQNMVKALEAKVGQIDQQMATLREQRAAALKQAAEYEAFLGAPVQKRKRGRPAKKPNGSAEA